MHKAMNTFTRLKRLFDEETSKRNALKLIEEETAKKIKIKIKNQMPSMPSEHETEKEDEQRGSIRLVRNT